MSYPVFDLSQIYYAITKQYFIFKKPENDKDLDKLMNNVYVIYFPEQNKINFSADGGIIYRLNKRKSKDYQLSGFLLTYKILVSRLFIPFLYLTGSNGNIIPESCDEIRILTFFNDTGNYDFYKSKMVELLETFLLIVKEKSEIYPETVKTILRFSKAIKHLIEKE